MHVAGLIIIEPEVKLYIHAFLKFAAIVDEPSNYTEYMQPIPNQVQKQIGKCITHHITVKILQMF